MRRGEKTKSKILDSAIRCLAKDGYEKTTFQSIANSCGVSQQLVVHHFKKKENVFPAVIDFLLTRTLIQTKRALEQKSSAKEKLKDYLTVSLQFFKEQPAIFKIYLTFYYLSGFDNRYRVINDQLKLEATTRIAEILYGGVENGEFKISDVGLTAKMIHVALTGLLLNLACEKSLYSDDQLLSQLEAMCNF